MNIVFRVDASQAIGIGHIVRCITLAEALIEKGVQVLFICRAHSGHMAALLDRHALPYFLLSEPDQQMLSNVDEYARWLGVTQADDAEQTIALIAASRPDWLIVDHYGLDAEWELLTKPYTQRLMVIDDLANRTHCCDLLLDQNYTKFPELRYVTKVPPSTLTLIGPQYALLRPEYAARRLTTLPREGPVKRILVFFGGSDASNMTGKTLEALSRPPLSELEVDVVLGNNNLNRESIEALAVTRNLTRLFGPLPHLANLMADADLAVGGGGTTVWERMCLGLPSIVISIAENQVPISTLLDTQGLIQYIGSANEIDVDDLFAALKTEINERRYAERSRLSMSICDGVGAARIVERLLHLESRIDLQTRRINNLREV